LADDFIEAGMDWHGGAVSSLPVTFLQYVKNPGAIKIAPFPCLFTGNLLEK
jgi:hypothetical protein